MYLFFYHNMDENTYIPEQYAKSLEEVSRLSLEVVQLKYELEEMRKEKERLLQIIQETGGDLKERMGRVERTAFILYDKLSDLKRKYYEAQKQDAFLSRNGSDMQ